MRLSLRPSPIVRAAAIAVLALGLGGFTSLESLFAPSARLWERWTAHDPAATAVIDHSTWDRLLQAYVVPGEDGVNRFAYAKVGAADRAALTRYIDSLAAVAISRYARPQQQAYWINLYNALTVRVVLDHYPVESIRDIDISPGLFASGPWDKKLVTIESQAVSLNDIEHRILRPIWHDPRIHYAVNCASIGCPNLRAQAYTAAGMEGALEAAATAYVNDPRGWRVEGGRLIASSIYTWFGEDFGGEAGALAHLKRYSRPERQAELGRFAEISGYAYDWSLNAAPAAP